MTKVLPDSSNYELELLKELKGEVYTPLLPCIIVKAVQAQQ